MGLEQILIQLMHNVPIYSCILYISHDTHPKQPFVIACVKQKLGNRDSGSMVP